MKLIEQTLQKQKNPTSSSPEECRRNAAVIGLNSKGLDSRGCKAYVIDFMVSDRLPTNLQDSFVCALPGIGSDHPIRFRTYDASELKNPTPGMNDCPIWKACRATSAAPTYFDSIDVKGINHSNSLREKTIFIDGGLGFNNPARQVLHEAAILEPFQNRICSLVSIGTGKLGV
jgi:hypothetical protein